MRRDLPHTIGMLVHGLGQALLGAVLVPLFLLGILVVTITGFLMVRRVSQEDAERPEPLRGLGGRKGWGLLAYFNRHGLDALAGIFLGGIIIIACIWFMVF